MKPRIIRRISIAPAARTRNAMHTPDGCITFGPAAAPEWQEISIGPGAQLTTETTDTPHGTRHTATLTAHTCTRHLPPALTAAATLRITLADGTSLIMGVSARPHPHILLTPCHPATPQEPAHFLLTATLTTDAPLPIIIS